MIEETVIDVIQKTEYLEDKTHLNFVSDENSFSHPFNPLENSFDFDENKEINFSDIHRNTTLIFYDPDEDWQSLNGKFDELGISDSGNYKLSPSIKTHFKEMLIKPDLTVKSKASLARKFSNTSGSSKFKAERKASIQARENFTSKIDQLDIKKERKSSVLFNIKRKRTSINESMKKKLDGSLLKLDKLRECFNPEDRKRSIADSKERSSRTSNRKYSTFSETGKKSKKLELTVDDFVLSPPNYNFYENNEDQQLDRNFISWSSKEKARKKVTNWLNKYVS